jgi:hypothetical protein
MDHPILVIAGCMCLLGLAWNVIALLLSFFGIHAPAIDSS